MIYPNKIEPRRIAVFSCTELSPNSYADKILKVDFRPGFVEGISSLTLYETLHGGKWKPYAIHYTDLFFI